MRTVTIEPRGCRGGHEEEKEDEERGVPATPRNAVLQLLRSSCCVNVLIQPAWARPIHDTVEHYFACHAIACEGSKLRFMRRQHKDGRR